MIKQAAAPNPVDSTRWKTLFILLFALTLTTNGLSDRSLF